MLLPLTGFLFALIVIGGLASLVAVGDPHHTRLAPYLGFISLLAGIGALCLSFGLAFLIGEVLHSEASSGWGFLGGYVTGGFGGAALGYKYASRRPNKIEICADSHRH